MKANCSVCNGQGRVWVKCVACNGKGCMVCTNMGQVSTICTLYKGSGKS